MISKTNKILWLMVSSLGVAVAWAGCSANGDTASSGVGGGFSGTQSNGSQSTTGTGEGNGKSSSSGGGQGGGLIIGDGGTKCTPPTCKELNATCGTITDKKCGGVVQCGTCNAPETCSNNGGKYACGTDDNPDGCAPQTCAQQMVNCGVAGDGCGNTIQCGTCTAPQTCGGDPNKKGQCGCTGTCAQVPTCTGGATTTLTGTVYDPKGAHPLYNALVYVPNNPSDPGLQPFPAGISCDICGAAAAGDPLVTAYTAPDGTFTLSGVPVGASIPLVIQLGRWRRQFTVAINNSCMPNSVNDGTLTMPKNQGEGDIPRIGILSGAWDAVECTLRKMGVDDGEFTNPGGGGRIQFYLAGEANKPSPAVYGPYYGHGAVINGSTPGQTSLFGNTGGTPTINNLDMVILECEGYEQDQSAADLAALKAYAEAGGRLFGSDYAYAWFFNNGNFSGVANWDVGQNPSGSPATGDIDLVSNPKGMAFEQWLQIVGASAVGSGTVSLNPVFHNSDKIVSPTQQWLYRGNQIPVHFTWNTPVGATSDNQCGRVVFSDWHAELRNQAGYGPPPLLARNETFPDECDESAMTPQQAILEFMLFDLSACVQPYTPVCTPTTCTAQGIQCGPAGDGCGGALDCGMCPTGEFCGGGGPGKCGTSMTCTPETCASQGIQCGQAGNGCGDMLNCGSCPTGQICGLSSPGKCGMLN